MGRQLLQNGLHSTEEEGDDKTTELIARLGLALDSEDGNGQT